MSAAELARKAEAWVQPTQDEMDALMSAGRPSEAKQCVVRAQRELRLIRRELVAEQRDIRMDFKQRRLGLPRRGSAAARRQLQRREQAAQEPYEDLKTVIDAVLVGMDRAKLEIDAPEVADDDTEVDELEPADDDDLVDDETESDPLRPPATPAQWVVDPTGRHELRYWDGSAWTSHVSDSGVQAADPL